MPPPPASSGSTAQAPAPAPAQARATPATGQGQQASGAQRGGRALPSATPPPPTAPRVMTLVDFRKQTDVTMSMRDDDVKAIDNALAAYETSKDVVLKGRALVVLKNLVTKWQTDHPPSPDDSRGVVGRRGGINDLDNQLKAQPPPATPQRPGQTVQPLTGAGGEVSSKVGGGIDAADVSHELVDTGIGAADTAAKRAGPALTGGYVDKATANSKQFNSNVGQSQAVGAGVQGLVALKGAVEFAQLSQQSATTDIGKSNLGAKKQAAGVSMATGTLGAVGNALSANGNFRESAGQQMAGSVLSDSVLGFGMAAKGVHDTYQAAKGASAMSDASAGTQGAHSDALAGAKSGAGDLAALKLASEEAKKKLQAAHLQLTNTESKALALKDAWSNSFEPWVYRPLKQQIDQAESLLPGQKAKVAQAKAELREAEKAVADKAAADTVAVAKVSKFLLLHELHLAGKLIYKNDGLPKLDIDVGGTQTKQDVARQEYQALRQDAGLVKYLKATRVEEIRAYSGTKLTIKAVTSAVEAAGHALDAVGTFTAAADMGVTKTVGKALKGGVAVSKAVINGVSRGEKVAELGRLKTLIDGKERGLGWAAEQWLMHDLDKELAKVRGMLKGEYQDAAHQGKYQAHVEHLGDAGREYEKTEVEDLQYARNERYARELAALALGNAVGASTVDATNAKLILSGLGIEVPGNYGTMGPAEKAEVGQAITDKYIRAITM